MKIVVLSLFAMTLAGQTRLTVCGSGCDHTTVQAAMDAAATSQATTCAPIVITVTAGAVYEAENVAPAKTCAQWVEIRGSQLSAPGRAVNSGTWPTLRARSGFETSPIFTFASTTHWRLRGLEISARTTGSLVYRLIELGAVDGGGTPVVATAAGAIDIDQCWIHGLDQADGPVRGVFIGSSTGLVSITNSYIEQIKATAADSPAIACVGCFGGLEIVNNYLEASGMAFLAGGSAASGQSTLPPGMAQRNFRVIGNRITRRPEWHVTTGTAAPTGACLTGSRYRDTAAPQNYICTASAWATTGTAHPVDFSNKNSIEWKDGQGITLAGNHIGPSWQDAQQGGGLLLNQSGGLTNNYEITDVRMVANRMEDVNAALLLGNLNYLAPNGTIYSRRLAIEHNLFDRLGPVWANLGGAQRSTSRWFATIESEDVRVNRNTVKMASGGYVHAMIASGDWRTFPTLWGKHQLAENIMESVDWVGVGLFGSWHLASGVTPCTFATTLPRTGGVWSEPRNVITGPASTELCVSEGPATGFYSVGGRTAAIASVIDSSLAVIGGGVAEAAAANGENAGAAQPWVVAMTAQAAAGASNGWLDAGLRSASLSGGTATIRYAMPTASSTCSAAVSSAEVFSSIGSPSQTAVGRIATSTITGATGARFLRLTCDGVVLPAERL